MKQKVQQTLSSLWVLSLFLFASHNAQAHGLLMHGENQTYASLQSGHIKIQIESQVATTIVEQTFRHSAVAGSWFYLFAMPERASAVQFEIWEAGQWKPAEMRSQAQDKLPPAAAQNTASFLGGNPFRIDLQKQNVETSTKIRFTFVELLTYEKGKVVYFYPLAPYKKDVHIAPQTLEISIRLQRPIASANILSHPLIWQKKSPEEWFASYTLSVAEQNKHLIAEYKAQQDDLSLRALTHRDPMWETEANDDAKVKQDGTFLLLLEPKENTAKENIIAKTFTMVIDISGSMVGDKVKQAKNAALRCIEGLHDQDYFNLLAFSNQNQLFREQAIPATPANRNAAKEFILSLQANGGTMILNALKTALEKAPKETERPHFIVFLTDGQGSNPNELILAEVQKSNTQKARIFAFGIGASYNRALLEGLAYATQGKASELDPSKIDETLAEFFLSINSPVLTNIQIDFGGADIQQLSPEMTQIPNVYLGSQLLLFGRYRSFGEYTFTIKGKIGSQNVIYSLKVNLAQKQLDNAFLPRIWAIAYVKDLYNRWIRGNQQDNSLPEQIKQLGLIFRIQTPFTSFGFTPPPSNPNNGSSTGNGSSGYADASGNFDAGNYANSPNREPNNQSVQSGGLACSHAPVSELPLGILLLFVLALLRFRRPQAR